MYDLTSMYERYPILPYIRESDYAVRGPWNHPERRLLDYLMVYVHEGHCLFTVDGVDYHLGNGDFCLIQPGSLVRLEGITSTITPFAHFDAFYQPLRAESFPTRAGQTDLTPYKHLLQPRLEEVFGISVPVVLKPRFPIRFRDAFLQMVRDWQDRDPLKQIRAQLAGTEVLLAILEDGRAAGHEVQQLPQSLGWVHSYLSYHLSEPIGIEDMARRANLSPSRFSFVFKRAFGKSPHQYLLDMRVNHAQELLEATGLPQEEIAAYCGFSDIHHFSKAFRKIKGKPPGHYRRPDAKKLRE